MKSYSEREIFGEKEIGFLTLATQMVGLLPDGLKSQKFNEVRCHELTRAIGRILDLDVQDGYYGYVEHSWLWTKGQRNDDYVTRSSGHVHAWDLRNILDVYAVGSLPMVRLVDMRHSGHAHGMAYRPSVSPRTDIDDEMVDLLVERLWRFT